MELRIKELCKEQGITMDMLSQIVDMSRTALSLINSGKMNTTIDTLERIAKGLNTSVTELFKEDNTHIKCPHCGKRIRLTKE